MTTMTLKNLPDVLHERLKARAVVNRRSLNAEAIACLEAAVAPARIDADAILARARTLRTRVKGRLKERTLRKMKEAGRP